MLVGIYFTKIYVYSVILAFTLLLHYNLLKFISNGFKIKRSGSPSHSR